MTTIDHTCIHVLDLDRSAAFYRDALGLTPVRSLDMPDRGWQLLFLGDGTTDFQLELCRETNRTAATTPPTSPSAPRTLTP